MRPTAPIRAFNALARWTGRPRFSLEPDWLVDRARRVAGLDDLGAEDWREGLEVLCRSAQEDALLTPFGRGLVQLQVVGSLVTRLRLVDARARREDALSQPLDRPLLVVGLPRSGTTLLHRLLAMAPGTRGPTIWESRNPLAGPGPDRRRSRARLQLAAFKLAAPGVDVKHRVELDAPEECMFLLDSSLKSVAFWVMAPVHGYLAWLLDQDLSPGYRTYRQLLQLLRADTPAARLVLKAPAHTPFLDRIFAEIPDALVVQTHRDPLPVVASLNSLFHSFHAAVSDQVDLERMGRSNLLMVERVVDLSLERHRRRSGQVLDVRYDDLVADPVGTVEAVHHHFGLPIEDGHRACLDAELSRPRRPHRYDVRDYGLDPDALHERFAPYRAAFLG